MLQVYELYNLFPLGGDTVAWWMLVRQIPTLIALFFVISFGSSMDIMAIQTQLPYDVRFPFLDNCQNCQKNALHVLPASCKLSKLSKLTPLCSACIARFFVTFLGINILNKSDGLPVDADRELVTVEYLGSTMNPFQIIINSVLHSFIEVNIPNKSNDLQVDADRELITVGFSNFCAGLLGAGATGSYIFSQTLFGLKAGATSRLQGTIIAVGEIAVFLIPYPLVQYLPNVYYGALVLVFGIEILMEWMVRS